MLRPNEEITVVPTRNVVDEAIARDVEDKLVIGQVPPT